MNLHWMALSAALVAILGYIAARRVENRAPVGCAVIIALILIMARGYYWNIFGRGEGFFTANRMSAFALLFVAYIIGTWIGAGRYLRDVRRDRFGDD